MHHPSSAELPGTIPGQDIVPLTESQREQYPHVVYEWGSDSPVETLVFNASVAAAQEAGLPLTIDRTVSPTDGWPTITIRTATEDHRQRRIESALVQGLTGAVEKGIAEGGAGALVATNPFEVAFGIAKRDIDQIVGNPSMAEAFKNYYGGLRWGTDQEKLVNFLFEQSAEYDTGFLETQLTGDDVSLLTYELDLDIGYKERRDWDKKSPAEIFADRPELDYRRLADPAFRDTPAGQQLYDAYRKLHGQAQAKAYKAYPQPITEQGTLQPKPLIPLAKFPIIESLITDEAAQSGPRAKYSFGASELVELIAHSDSKHALDAVVRTLSSRLPEDARHVFDGPSEFEHKRNTVRHLLRAFDEASDDAQRREPLKQALLSILSAYTGQGAIAESIRAEHDLLARPESRQWYRQREVREVKQIVMDILTFALASPDANDFTDTAVLGTGTELALSTAGQEDILALSQNDLITVVLDSLGQLGTNSNPRTIQRAATQAFQNAAIADRIGHIAELNVAAAHIRRSPEVLLAFKGLRSFRFSMNGEADPERLRAEQARKEATAPADELSRQARQELNGIMLECLHSIADTGALQGGEPATTQLFKAFVNRIDFGGMWEANQLPQVYRELAAMAQRDDLADRRRGEIFWHFAEKVQYAGDNVRLLLPATILDIYRAALGPLNAVRQPSDETDHILAAASFIAEKNNVFAHATDDQLVVLARYHGEVLELAKTLGVNLVLPSKPQAYIKSLDEETQQTLRNFQDTLRALDRIEDSYRRYLHIEEVKREPAVYYPWLAEKLLPFWSKMQWEVGPGNRPTAEISALHGVIKGFLAQLKPEPPQDFDYLTDGALGEFLIECYNRMVVPHDIKYNTTVWQDGLSFMHYAIAYMPASLVEDFKARYPRQKDFLAYLQKERARWNKDDVTDTTSV